MPGRRQYKKNPEKSASSLRSKKVLPGIPLKPWPEVKADPVAYKEFVRIRKLLRSIGKNDDLFAAMINTQAKLRSEERQQVKVRRQLFRLLKDFENNVAESDMPWDEYLQIKIKIQELIVNCDQLVMQKRKLIFEISKENAQTIQSAFSILPANR